MKYEKTKKNKQRESKKREEGETHTPSRGNPPKRLHRGTPYNIIPTPTKISSIKAIHNLYNSEPKTKSSLLLVCILGKKAQLDPQKLYCSSLTRWTSTLGLTIIGDDEDTKVEYLSTL